MDVKYPSDDWRSRKNSEHEAFVAGRIAAKDCFMQQLFPDDFIDRTGVALKTFTAAISSCSSAPDAYPSVMQAIQNLVLSLNEINDDFDGEVIETGEREELCEFIDNVLAAHGIDVDDLAASNGCGRFELGDKWREW